MNFRSWALAFVIVGAAGSGRALASGVPTPEPVLLGGLSPLCKFQDPRINECSGLAVSRLDPGVLWTHNDSGDSARVFAVNLSGQTTAVVNLTNAEAHDWEDIDIAVLGGSHPKSFIYVGDIGDNAANRSKIQVYRFAEPVLKPASGAKLARAPLEMSCQAQRLDLIYPDGPHDAETLLAAPDGNLVIFSKSLQGSGIYRTPSPFVAGATLTLEKMGDLQFGSVGLLTRLATGGDFSQNGRKLAIVTYTHLYEWSLPAPYDLRGLKIEGATKRLLPPLKQCEAVSYAPGGAKLYLSSEKAGAPIYAVSSGVRDGPASPRR